MHWRVEEMSAESLQFKYEGSLDLFLSFLPFFFSFFFYKL